MRRRRASKMVRAPRFSEIREPKSKRARFFVADDERLANPSSASLTLRHNTDPGDMAAAWWRWGSRSPLRTALGPLKNTEPLMVVPYASALQQVQRRFATKQAL